MAAALKHQWVDRDALPQRVLSGRTAVTPAQTGSTTFASGAFVIKHSAFQAGKYAPNVGTK